MMILNGRGDGDFRARVTESGRLWTESVTEPFDKNVNRAEGKAWTVTLSVTPVGAGDYIFYLKNTGDVALAFTDLRAVAGAATTLKIGNATGTPTFTTGSGAGTPVTPAVRNFGSNETLQGDVIQDTDITGMTFVENYFLRLDTANKADHLRTTSNLIIPKGTIFMMSSSAATLVDATLSFSEQA